VGFQRFCFKAEGGKKLRREIEQDLYLTPFKNMSPKMGLSPQEIGDAFSRKAFTFFSRKLNAYVIAYNEVLPFIEIVYYILHEIGHIYYEHVSPDKEVTDSLTNQESVANHFATFIFSQIGGYTMKTHTGNEHFTFDGMPAGILLNDFWAWSSSDLLNNTLRGALAEYIVASALGINTNESRCDWTAFDLLSQSGRKIEVKSSAYLQSWTSDRLSKIQFCIRPTRSWDEKNAYSDEVKRWSDLYIFSLYASKDKRDSPLQLNQWQFYVLPTEILNRKCGAQKTITLNMLLSLEPQKATYETLNEIVDNI